MAPLGHHKAEMYIINESYKNYPSIKQIPNNLKLLENEEKFCFKMVITKYIKSLFPKVNTKKAVGIDTILSKLVKLAADPVSQPYVQATNICIKQSDFPNNAKVTSVVPLGKDKSDNMICQTGH